PSITSTYEGWAAATPLPESLSTASSSRTSGYRSRTTAGSTTRRWKSVGRGSTATVRSSDEAGLDRPPPHRCAVDVNTARLSPSDIQIVAQVRRHEPEIYCADSPSRARVTDCRQPASVGQPQHRRPQRRGVEQDAEEALQSRHCTALGAALGRARGGRVGRAGIMTGAAG